MCMHVYIYIYIYISISLSLSLSLSLYIYIYVNYTFQQQNKQWNKFCVAFIPACLGRGRKRRFLEGSRKRCRKRCPPQAGPSWRTENRGFDSSRSSTCIQGALEHRLTQTGRRRVRGGARSHIVRQTIVSKGGNLYRSCFVRRPCIVRPCIVYNLSLDLRGPGSTPGGYRTGTANSPTKNLDSEGLTQAYSLF